MRRRSLLAALVLVLAVACRSASPGPDLSARNADVDALVTAVTTLHPEPFAALPRERWDAAVADLRRQLPDMDDDQFRVGLARLANLGDRNGHGGAFVSDQPAALGVWPLRLYEFADGWYVVDAHDRSLVGARVEAVGGRPMAEVADWLAPMVPRDNAHSLEARLASYVVSPAFLRGSGVPAGPLTLVSPGGERWEVTPPTVPPAEYATLAGLDVPQIPLALPRPPYAPRDDYWWSQRRGDALVVGYERVLGEMPDGRRLRRFVERLREDVAARRTRVVVVDARRNPGGENESATPLTSFLRELAAERRIPVRVLISRSTYSAASLTLAPLRDVVRFYGEPTGGGTTTYGNPSSRTLPASGLVVHVAGRRSDAPGPSLAAIEPDVAVAVTWHDHSRGVDAVLDAALRP